MNHRRDLLFSAYLGAAFVASIMPELKAERYGAPSYIALLPAGSSIAKIGDFSSLGAIVLGLIVLLRELVNNRSNRRSSSRDYRIKQSQASIWWPYLVAWLVSATINFTTDAPTYVFTSLFIIAVAASYRQERRDELVPRLNLLLLRSYVAGSVVLGLLWPARARAPYATWPGGWWPDIDRLQGLAPHPNTLGWIAALLIAIEIILGLTIRRPLAIVFLAVGAIALAESGSRTATLALAGGLIALYVGRISTKSVLLGRLARLALIGCLLTVGGMLLLDGFGVDSFNGRITTWSASLDAFTANPFFGIGPFEFASGDVDGVGYAHNQVLQTLAELGIFGLAALAIHVTALIRHARNSSNRDLWLLTTMWLIMFVSENLLRFGDPGFGLQILFFQMGVMTCLSCRSGHRGRVLQNDQIGKIVA